MRDEGGHGGQHRPGAGVQVPGEARGDLPRHLRHRVQLPHRGGVRGPLREKVSDILQTGGRPRDYRQLLQVGDPEILQ